MPAEEEPRVIAQLLPALGPQLRICKYLLFESSQQKSEVGMFISMVRRQELTAARGSSPGTDGQGSEQTRPSGTSDFVLLRFCFYFCSKRN